MSRSLDIKWRQGDILSAQDLAALKPPERIIVAKDTLAVTISHSCDIASNESTVEFICATTVDEKNGNYILAKNPRKLHLQIISSMCLTIELTANQKFEIKKEVLGNYDPDTRYVLDLSQRKILQDWLAARYKRQALPDSLKDRLGPILEFLEKKGKKNAADILGYFVRYDPDEELSSEQPYDFSLYIVYSVDNPEFEGEAKILASEIKEKFSALTQRTANIGSVQLVECKAYSEVEFTLRDLRQNNQYRFDYLSYKTEPHGPTI